MSRCAQAVLVDASGGRDPAFQLAEDRHEEAGLPEHALGAAIAVGGRLEASDHEAIEILHRPAAASQLVVERQDLDDQSGAQAERRRRARFAGSAGGAADEHLALELGEQRRASAAGAGAGDA